MLKEKQVTITTDVESDVTLITGKAASGKSTIVREIAISQFNKNKRILFVTTEVPVDMIKSQLQLQIDIIKASRLSDINAHIVGNLKYDAIFIDDYSAMYTCVRLEELLEEHNNNVKPFDIITKWRDYVGFDGHIYATILTERRGLQC